MRSSGSRGHYRVMVECSIELPSDSNSAEFHTVVFDANPLPTFVLDAESRIVDFNAAASEFLGTAPSEVFRHRTGDLFQCANAMETPGGCGTSAACDYCGIRHAIAEALNGDLVSRCCQPMELVRNDEKVGVDFLVTAAPVQDSDARLALLILEDVTELMELREQNRTNRAPDRIAS